MEVTADFIKKGKKPPIEEWSFTDDVNMATKFNSLEKAKEMKDIIERAVSSTFWDYDDIIQYPKIRCIQD